MIGLDSAMSRRHGREDWNDYLVDGVLNNPKGGISIFITDRFIGLLYACIIFIPWNLVASLLQLEFQSWKYGMYFLMIVGVFLIFVFPHEYLSDFKEFKLWPENERRKFDMITVLIIIVIFAAWIGSFTLYMSTAINKSK
jgi:hypothetical protein